MNILNEYILSLAKEKGFKKFTEPQKKAIPYILKGYNVLIVAPTGSGKTEAAFLPILQMMMSYDGKPIKLIYITPLRALNRDLIERLIWWAGKLDLKISVRHGDTPKRERRIQAESPPDILITTPETFSFLLNTKIMGKHIRNVRWIIIDEVHELISSKRGVQLSINLERLREYNGNIQVIGLSATVGEPKKILEYITGGKEGVIITTDISKKIKIELDYPESVDKDYKDINKLYTYPEVIARVRRINDLIKNYRATLIFTNTRPMAEILGNRILLYDDTPIMVHHGSLGSDMRIRVERMFKEGMLKGIICTSSLELGIDIGDIDLVIQYGSPRQAGKLLQRIGRSGHWIERVSHGVVIVQDPDDALEALIIRNRALNNKLEKIKIFDKPLDVLTHEIVGMTIGKRKIHINNLMRILSRSIFYRDINREDLEKLLKFHSETQKKILYFSYDGWIRKSIYRDRIYKYYFDNLSMIPETKQYIVVNDVDNSIVGVLDEDFISIYGEPGTKIIMGGRVWKIIQIFKERVYVKPDEDPFGAIPDWVGEEIPVPYDIAQEVGELKRVFKEAYKEFRDFNRAIERLSSKYNIDGKYLSRALYPYYLDLKDGREIPTDRDILIEKIDNKIIIHIHGGTLVNRTITGYIANVLLNEYGETIKYSSDQYKIFIQGFDLDINIILDLLRSIDKFKRYIKTIVVNSNVFKWRFTHVAKRMGIISKDVYLKRSEVDELIKMFRGTPVYEETYKETMLKDFDMDNTLDIISKITQGYIEFHISRDGYSNIMREYLKYHEPKYEYLDAERKEILEVLSLKIKTLNKVVTLICLECMNYIKEMRIRELDDYIKCPICGSSNIGMSERLYEDVYRLVDMAKTSPGYIRRHPEWRRILKSSEIISKYGKVGVYALAIEGLKIRDINELLKVENRISDRLTKLILDRVRRNLLERVLRGRRE